MTNLKPCPACGQRGIDTTQPAENFWRCQCCKAAVVKRGGRLRLWLNPYQKAKRG